MKKILFLDIDGVLNSHRTYFGLGKLPYRFQEEHRPYFDWAAVGMLRKLVEADPAIHFVLSSAWRIGIQRDGGVEGAAAFLGLPLIDVTDTKGPLRGFEIKRWLEANPEIEYYAIIDDDGDMLEEQAPHFVQTTFAEGMMYQHFKALQRILDGKLGGLYRRPCFWSDKTPCTQEELDAYNTRLLDAQREGDI